MSLRHAAALCACAARDLAISHGSLQDRLINVCRTYLSNVGEQDDMPAPLWDIHAALCAQVVRGISKDEADPFTVRFAMMGDVEAADMAERIVDLASRLRSLCEAPPWHYVGDPTAVIRVMAEPLDPDPSIRDPEMN